MQLYTYYRSSAAYRVRIALNLKGLAYEAVPVHLVKDGGQQHDADFRTKNPLASVPVMATDAGAVLTQSLAIIEYLDESYPLSPLLPSSAEDRARVRALAQVIACDIHPLNNLRVLNYLTHQLGVSSEQKNAWYQHWINEGLGALEKMLASDARTGRFCHGNEPGLADCCLVPQVYNARRFKCPLDAIPVISRIVDACELLPAFQAASPGRQPDAE